jgi:flagellar basal-body rod protein FlgG
MPNPLYRSAVTGIRAQQRAMDITANNLANVSTTGYKRVRTDFRDLLYERLAAGRVPDPTAPVSPVAVGGGARADAATRFFNQGALQATGRVLDLAILGEGFFEVRTADGQIAYTRDGTLHVDADGSLTIATGERIEPPITLPQDLDSLYIDERGVVRGTRGGTDDDVTFGQLRLTRFINPGGLLAVGHNLFVPSANSGEPRVGQPGAAGFPELASGFLEGSNVDLGTEMTHMVQAQRAYQVNLKGLQAIDEMTGQALQLRR